jgi:hypothetical protein
MKMRCLNVVTTIYIAFALLAAHTALAPHETSSASGADSQTIVVASEEVVLDHQRLYQSDANQVDKSDYTIEIWTAEWCGKCPVYKRRVEPALLKLGYTLTNKDWDADAKERPKNMQAVPSVRIYYKGTFLQMWVAPPTRAINRYVEMRVSLKEST